MITESSSTLRQRDPWNKGRLIGQKRPLKPKDVWTVRVRLQLEGRKRDLAMFNLAIDSKLRGCDLVRLRVDDVLAGERVRDRATVIQKKSGRPVSLRSPSRPGARSASGWPFRHPLGSIPVPEPFSAAAASLDAAVRPHRPSMVERAGLDSSAYGTHSLRRTKAAQIYRKTGNLRAVQLLLGHTKLESTIRYLGIEVDDALTISEQVEL